MTKVGHRWRARLGGALLAALLLLAATAHADAPTVESVAAQLEEVAALLEAGDEAAARERLAALDAVRLDDGREMALASEAWETVLDETPEVAPDVIRAAAATLREPREPLPPDAWARLDAVLARAEFQPAQPSLWNRLLRWLLDLLPDWSLDPARADAVWDVVGWGIAGISAVVVVIVLALFLRGLTQSVLGDEQLDLLGEGEVPLHAGEAQARATAAAGAGNFREAMRLLYLAALLHLDEVGRIRFNRALTNREVLDSVAGDAPLRGLLAPVVAQFDRVWYGHAPFGQADFERVREQIERLRTMERRT